MASLMSFLTQRQADRTRLMFGICAFILGPPLFDRSMRACERRRLIRRLTKACFGQGPRGGESPAPRETAGFAPRWGPRSPLL